MSSHLPQKATFPLSQGWLLILASTVFNKLGCFKGEYHDCWFFFISIAITDEVAETNIDRNGEPSTTAASIVVIFLNNWLL